MIDLHDQQEQIKREHGKRWHHDPEARRKMAALWGCAVGEHVNDHSVFKDVREVLRVALPGKCRDSATIKYAVSPKGWFATGHDINVGYSGAGSPVSVHQTYPYESLTEAIEWEAKAARRWLENFHDRGTSKADQENAHRLISLLDAAVRDAINPPEQAGLFSGLRKRCRIVPNHWNPEDLHLIDLDGYTVPGSKSFYRSVKTATQDAEALGWELAEEVSV